MAGYIGIDPGKETGIAWLSSRRYVEDLAVVKKKKNEDSPDFAYRVASLIKRSHPYKTKILIERPMIYPNSPKRDSDILELTWLSGCILMCLCCLLEDNSFDYVYPVQWKGQVPKDIHNERLVQHILGLENRMQKLPKAQRNHAIDAAGIAYYAATRKRI